MKKEKTCNKCKKNKNVSEFRKHKKSKDGLDWICRLCKSINAKKYYEKNLEKILEYQLKKRKINDINKNVSKEKTCRICKKNKKISEYYKSYGKKDGYRNDCKECSKVQNKINSQKLPKNYIILKEKQCSKCKEVKDIDCFFYSRKSKTLTTSNCKKCREDYEKIDTVKEARSVRVKNKRKNNKQFRISSVISCGIYKSIKDKKNGKHWENIVGYTLKELMDHLESQFEPWMSWENHGVYKPDRPRTWQIDHIIPKSMFKFDSYEDEEFKLCWSLKNLQPKEAQANISKGKRFIG